MDVCWKLNSREIQLINIDENIINSKIIKNY